MDHLITGLRVIELIFAVIGAIHMIRFIHYRISSKDKNL